MSARCILNTLMIPKLIYIYDINSQWSLEIKNLESHTDSKRMCTMSVFRFEVMTPGNWVKVS